MNYLQTHVVASRIARTGVGVFVWLAIFYYFEQALGTKGAIAQALSLYLLVQTVAVLAIPLAGDSMSHGVLRTIATAIVCYVTAMIFLAGGLGGYFGPMLHVGLVAFALAYGVFMALYWLPYAASDGNDTADLLSTIAGLMPLIVGMMLTVSFGQMPAALLMAATIAAASLMPLTRLTERAVRVPWGYREMFGELFNHANRRIVTTSLAEGVESAALFFVWPIVVFLLLGRSFLLMGALTTVIIACAPFIRIVSREWHKSAWRESSKPSRILISIGAWVLRLSAASFVTFVVVDSYSSITSEKRLTSWYDREVRADGGFYIDEYTLVKEMAVTLGRIGAMILFGLLLTVFHIWTAVACVFGLAALAAVLLFSSGGAEEPFV